MKIKNFCKSIISNIGGSPRDRSGVTKSAVEVKVGGESPTQENRERYSQTMDRMMNLDSEFEATDESE